MTIALRRATAYALLQTYGDVSLQQMARHSGIDIKGQNRKRLSDLLGRRLYDPDRIRAAFNDLEPVERDALDIILVADGEIRTSALRRELENADKIDPPPPRDPYGRSPEYGSVTTRGSRRFEDIIGRLAVSGLVFTANVGGRQERVEFRVPGSHLFIPFPIVEHLPAVTLAVEPASPPAQEQPAAMAALHRDLYLLLSAARNDPIPLTSRGNIPKRNLIQLNASFRLQEPVPAGGAEGAFRRIALLRALGEDLRLLSAGAGALQVGEEAAAFLARPQGERQRALYDAYRTTTRWPELLFLPGVAARPREVAMVVDVREARGRILTELAALPTGQWISLDHLISRIRIRAHEFLLPRRLAPTWYWRAATQEYGYSIDPYYGENPFGLNFYRETGRGDVGWNDVEGGFIRIIVAEALHWLGIVDLGGPAADQCDVFRISPEGAVLLAGGTPPSPPVETNVVVQPNFQLFAFEPTGEDVLFTLDLLARRVRAEQVVEYQLSRDSIYAAQRAGMDIADILAFLQRVSSTPLPANVLRSLEEWGAQHERIVFRRGISLLQTVDEASLDALYADADLRPLLGRRLTATSALVPAAYLHTLAEVLLTSTRYPLPALSEGDDSGRQSTLRVDGAGHITFQQPLPSIHVLRALRAFTEDEQGGPVRITPESLRRAARDGFPADDIIAILQRLHVGELPEEAITLVRRWAKDWGRGALASVTVLQVENAETMADLLADVELKPHLRALPGAPTLAVVRDGHAEEVRRLLDERGMDVRGALF